MTKFASLGIYDYLPDFNAALRKSTNSISIYRKYAYLVFLVEGIFVVIGIIDWFYFIFHPFEIGIVIDVEEKRE